ncbi:MAG TPA: HAMP domain-containing sensor histidine kinase, partial [Nitrosomonas sp.]|nr:HAMP domain-containing sensor histidine kinase [Nitrosomonas sp.]
LVAYRIGLHEVRQRELRLILVISLVIVITVVFVVGHMLAGLVVKQVTQLADRVRRLAPGNINGEKLSQPGQDDEIALLARLIDDYQVRITRMLRREQEFTANLSHELRTPITTIQTSCELLLTEPNLPERTYRRIKMIEGASARMGEHIQALLFLAREQDLGEIELVNITECILEIVDSLQNEISQKQLRFQINVPNNATLKLNRQALNIVLINLIRNAVQYTEEGFITVEFRDRQLSIIDSGIGIEPASMPFLYDRFFRATTQGRGLGIGLAIVKRICDYYEWRIEVDSKPGRGTTFKLTFPLSTF